MKIKPIYIVLVVFIGSLILSHSFGSVILEGMSNEHDSNKKYNNDSREKEQYSYIAHAGDKVKVISYDNNHYPDHSRNRDRDDKHRDDKHREDKHREDKHRDDKHRDNKHRDDKHSGNNDGLNWSEIPRGDKDLYILKSQIVPPICPVCPQACNAKDKDKHCQPCAPCGRCPESAFTCEKVPQYNSPGVSNYLPRPVLADFSQFGM